MRSLLGKSPPTALTRHLPTIRINDVADENGEDEAPDTPAARGTSFEDIDLYTAHVEQAKLLVLPTRIEDFDIRDFV